MAERLPEPDHVPLEHLVRAQAFELAALVAILERKGILTQAEVVAEIERLVAGTG